MKHIKRLACTVLAVALCGAVLLTGCSAPRLTIGGTAQTAATIGDTTLSTGEYLAYLYNTFYNMYYSQGLYQYAQYGYDVWGQEYTYGEGDEAEKMAFDEYLKRTAQDSAVRQVALRQLMDKYKISWNADELKELEENLANVQADSYLSLGISKDNFVKVTKELSLNETGLFYGLYGEGGQREMSEADRKAYFDENYLSYKMISVALTDSKGAELDAAGKKKITDELEGYLAQYNKSGNFEAVVDAYNKAKAGEDDEKPEASKDEDNRKNLDGKTATDEDLVKAIRSVDVGKAKVVTYKAGGTTETAALILRLDIHTPESLFTDETKNIIRGAKYDEFDKEVKETVKGLTVKFNKSVVKQCNPQNFLSDASSN